MKKFSVFFLLLRVFCFSLYFCKSDWFSANTLLKVVNYLVFVSVFCVVLARELSGLSQRAGTISVQTFPDNKNRRVKWCYKTRNRTKLKIYQRKTSTNPFFSQGIVFDHRSADLKKKKETEKQTCGTLNHSISRGPL